MCGIFGVVDKKEQKLGPVLVEAGRRLSYRGYDSVGCATMRDDGTVDLRKDVGKVDEVTVLFRIPNAEQCQLALEVGNDPRYKDIIDEKLESEPNFSTKSGNGHRYQDYTPRSGYCVVNT